MSDAPRPVSRAPEWLALAATLALVALVRLMALHADPTVDLQGGFVSDWGGWWKNARQHALWGAWRLDHVNRGLYAATGHTWALRLAFALFGVGVVPAILVSVASGLLTTLVVYGVARHAWGPRTGVLAALLVGITPITIAYDRSAYPESLQTLWLTLALTAIVVAPRNRGTAALGGVALAAAVIVKLTGVVAVPIAAAAWGARWVMDRRVERQPFAWRSCAEYWAAAAAVMAVFVLAFVLPQRVELMAQVREMAATNQGAETLVSPDRIPLLGWYQFGLRRSGFFVMEWYLGLAVLALLAGRVTRTLRLPFTAVEAVMWSWLIVGLLSVAVLKYQPDRRFVMLTVPMAVLTAGLFSRPVTLGPSLWPGARSRRLGNAFAAALVAGMAGFLLIPLVGWHIVGRAGFDLSYADAGSVLVSAPAVVAALAALRLGDRLRWPNGSARLTWLPVALVALMLARFGRDMTQRRYGLQQTSADIARIADSWPAPERILWGWTAPTFAMGTRLLGITATPRSPELRERLAPRLLVTTTPPGDSLVRRNVLDGPGGPFVDCADIPLGSDHSGAVRMMVHLYITAERASACRHALAAPTAAAANDADATAPAGNRDTTAGVGS